MLYWVRRGPTGGGELALLPFSAPYSTARGVLQAQGKGAYGAVWLCVFPGLLRSSEARGLSGSYVPCLLRSSDTRGSTGGVLSARNVCWR
jgi:hypothetical protein